jgi:hypothetical protein
LLLHGVENGAVADDGAFRAELFAELLDFALSLRQVFGEFLLLRQIFESQRDVVGDSQGEFQIIGVRDPVRLRGIRVEEANDLAVLPDWRANDAR